ncbi:MAG: DUF4398 domain-containing protein [Treponema sp.]|nr:DUF4398 domain-containing protein [Treponema sp.]
MKKHCGIVAAVFVLMAVMTACARPPVEEMNMAHDAVIRAENDVNAVNYAGNTLIRARDILTRMQSEADARRFDEARNFAAEAIRLAELAIAEGRSGAAWARDDAVNLLDSLGAQLAETTNALNAAGQAGVLNVDFDALSRDLYSARLNYDNARQNLAVSNYGDAIANGQGARFLLGHINGRLNEAAQLALRK